MVLLWKYWNKKWNKVETTEREKNRLEWTQNNRKRHTRDQWRQEKPRLSERIHMFYVCVYFHWKFIDKGKKSDGNKREMGKERERERGKKQEQMQNWFSTLAWCVHLQFFFVTSLLHFVVLIMFSRATFNSMGE